MSAKSTQERLDEFIDKYEPEIAELAREVLVKMRERLPEATQMVYDNYNALVIGFGPSERPSEAIFSIVLYPRWVTLCFLQGAGLPDPHRLLQGSGKVVRHLRLREAEDLDKPEVQALIEAALDRAKAPLEGNAEGTLIIKSISEKQRPRRATK